MCILEDCSSKKTGIDKSAFTGLVVYKNMSGKSSTYMPKRTGIIPK